MRDNSTVGRKHRLFCAALIGIGVGAATPALAQTPAEFFADRQVTLLIGGGAGGSVDIYGRLLARHIGNKLPARPVIVPRNFPASGGVQAFMSMGTTAARDGSVFATSARGPLSDPLLSERKAAYDPRAFNWIGSINEDMSLCFTGKGSKVRSLSDAQSMETTMGATGALAESAKFPLMVNALANTKFRVITGYRGASGTRLAVERGEVDGQCTTFGSIIATQPEVLTGDDFNFIMQIGEKKHPRGRNAPLIMDFAKTDADRRLLSIIIKPLLMTSSFALPADVPKDRIAAWRSAFQATLIDKDFIEEARKFGLEISSRTGEEVQAIVEDLYRTPKAEIERARAIFAYAAGKR